MTDDFQSDSTNTFTGFDNERRVTSAVDADRLLESPVGVDVGRLRVYRDDRAGVGLSEDQKEVPHLLRRRNDESGRERAGDHLRRLSQHLEAPDEAPIRRMAIRADRS